MRLKRCVIWAGFSVKKIPWGKRFVKLLFADVLPVPAALLAAGPEALPAWSADALPVPAALLAAWPEALPAWSADVLPVPAALLAAGLQAWPAGFAGLPADYSVEPDFGGLPGAWRIRWLLAERKFAVGYHWPVAVLRVCCWALSLPWHADVWQGPPCSCWAGVYCALRHTA